jgi:hypothetical protein
VSASSQLRRKGDLRGGLGGTMPACELEERAFS